MLCSPQPGELHSAARYFLLPRCSLCWLNRISLRVPGVGFGASWLGEEHWKLYSSSPHEIQLCWCQCQPFVCRKGCQDGMGDSPPASPSEPVAWESGAWAALCPAPSEQCAEATPPAPCFVCIAAEVSCKLICCSIMCCCSENQKSLNWQDKCLSLALHDQVLTFKLVTYLVGLSKCPLAFISKFSEALKLVRPFRNFLIPCNKLINCIKIQFSFKSCGLRRSSEVSAVPRWRGDTSLNSQGT